MGLGPEASRSGAYSSAPASSSSSSLYNSSSTGGSASTSTGVVDPSVLRDYAAFTNPLVVVYSSDLSGFDMSFAVREGRRAARSISYRSGGRARAAGWGTVAG